MTEEVISVVLIPKLDFEIFYKFSRNINNSLFNLDEQHIPHITIAQFDAPHSSRDLLVEWAKSLVPQYLTVKTSGISFVTEARNGYTWVELQILKTKELSGLQRQIVNSQFSKKYKILNPTEDSYRPHLTLGIIKGYDISNMNLEEYTDILNAEFEVRLAAGINGEYYTFLG